MEDLSGKTCLIYDHGLFVELAVRLAQDFGRVYYYTPWQTNYPKQADALIGKNLDGVIVENPLRHGFWDLIELADVIVFPDVHDGPLQTYLRAQGKAVWGSGKGELIELDRWMTKYLLGTYDLPVAYAEKITGFDNLNEHLKNVTDKYIKIPIWRGDMETFHHVDYDMSSPWLDELAHTIGPYKDFRDFIVEDSIPGIEVGYDGYCINGAFPSMATFGYEIKDQGFIGQAREYSDFPAPLKEINEVFLAEVLSNHEYNNFISTELRIGDDQIPYLIDPCMRMASPPGEIVTEWFENISEIIWNGAHGILIDPVITKKYGVSLMFNSEWAKTNWLEVKIPDDMRRWVKLRNAMTVEGNYYVIPQVVTSGVGSVIAIEDSLEEAIDVCKERAKEIQAYNMSYNPAVLDDAVEIIEKGEGLGIHW